MPLERTYYDLLGLHSDATPEQIRRAYLRLLKQHHPDLANARQRQSTPEIVPLLNRCYGVLRDARKRAAYDAELERAHTAMTPQVQAASPAPVSSAKGQRRGAPAMLGAAAGLAAAVVAVSSLGMPQSLLDQSAGVLWPKYVVEERSLPPPPLDSALVRQEARIATIVPLHEAVARSQRCFKEAQKAGSLKLAQFCVIFDDAVIYWRKAPADAATWPVYFDEQVAYVRHAGSLAPLGVHADDQMQKLRSTAFRALLAELTSRQAADELMPAASPHQLKPETAPLSQNEP